MLENALAAINRVFPPDDLRLELGTHVIVLDEPYAVAGVGLGGLGPALGAKHGVVPRGPGAVRERQALYREGPEAAAALFATARAELDAGRPALAMVIGRELHWMDDERHERACLELLGGAYRALGRDALASILEVHHRHRDLRSVGVYASPL